MATLHHAGLPDGGLGEIGSTRWRDTNPCLASPVILTFDDGYRDFLTAAMPTLRLHGFSATVFLVADRIGGTAHWDAEYGEPARLLSWEEVRALQEAGIEMGCHSSLHRPMTEMRRTELVEDTMRARAILEEGLATPIKTLAYPYGAENEFVRRVIKGLGFRAAVSCEPGISHSEVRCGFPVSGSRGARQSVCSHRNHASSAAPKCDDVTHLKRTSP
jgi:peptidoglycan/xylan/chitin deacetylase (PgdA/CDA1 family)